MALLEALRSTQHKVLEPQVQYKLGPKELVEQHYKEAIPYNRLQQLAKHQQLLSPHQKLLQLRNSNTLQKSGPQGMVKPNTLIEDPSYWYSSQYSNSDEHIYYFTKDDINELNIAIKHAQEKKIKIQDISKEDFVLPTLGPKLTQFREEVRAGRGFQLMKGIPVGDYTKEELMIGYWGMGLYWGNMASQNQKGHYVGHIKSLDADVKNPNTRVYMTNLAQPFHTDSCDQVSLLCIHPAKTGGNSSWTSTVTIHNELLKLGRGDLVEVLTSDFYMDRKGEIPKGKKPYYRMPLMSYYQGYFQTAYAATYYELAQRHEEVPRLTEKQKEALLWFNSLAQSDKLRMDYQLEEGDIQLLSNHTMLHNRTEYVEYEEPEKRRHLLRLWIAPENERELPEQYADHFGSTEPGNRGGIIVPDVNYNRVPLDAE